LEKTFIGCRILFFCWNHLLAAEIVIQNFITARSGLDTIFISRLQVGTILAVRVFWSCSRKAITDHHLSIVG
jgi:hypothetical protein